MILTELINFGLNFLNFKRFEKNVEYRLLKSGFQAFINNNDNTKPLKNEQKLQDYFLKKKFIQMAKIFDSMAKLAKAHKKCKSGAKRIAKIQKNVRILKYLVKYNILFGCRRILSILRNNAYLRKAKKEMKVYYKGVLFRNWLKAIKMNSREDKTKAINLYRHNYYSKFLNILKKNYDRNQKIKIKLENFFKIYFGKLKKQSFRTLRLETKYNQS